MPYGKDDARSALPTAAAKPVPEDMSGAGYAAFYDREPDVHHLDARIWYARGQNLVIGYGEVSGRTVLDFDEAEEHMLMLPDEDTKAVITTPDETVESPGRRIVVLPPGKATIELDGRHRFVSLVRSTSPVAALAENAESYAEPHPNIPPFTAWPAPVDGYKVRVYDVTVPTAEGTAMRIFRCSTIMVNYFNPKVGPRDRKKFSPHHHDDFEQFSLVLDGQYIHHLRWPWGTDADRWRDDDHVRLGAPSVTIIPPPSVHTSEAADPGVNWLIDVFSPPREDFAQMAGWVINAAEYPLPETLAAP